MIQSLMRSLDLLEVLKGSDHKISIAELSEQLELPPSTIHRILQTFCEKKYVIRDEHTHTSVSYTHLDVYKRQMESTQRMTLEVKKQSLSALPVPPYSQRQSEYR